MAPWAAAALLCALTSHEKRCLTCGDFWPADHEFFQTMRSSRDGLTPRCIACIKARLWQMPSRCRFPARPEVVSHRLDAGGARGGDKVSCARGVGALVRI